MKTKLANLLFRLAQRLSPTRPIVVADKDGYEVRVSGYPLARLSPGIVKTN